MKRRNEKGITLIALIITIIIMLILAGVVIGLVLGNNGLIGKTKEAKETTNKQSAIEQINLKITNSIMKKYGEEQGDFTLKEIANDFYKDNEIEYIKIKDKKIEDIEEIEVGEYKSFFTKLREYPYEFEINSSLELSSIDGIKIQSTNTNNNLDFKLEYMGLNIAKDKSGNKTYEYDNKEIYPLYWYGYKENIITAKYKSAPTSAGLYERTDITKETTSYLRFSETGQYGYTYWVFNENVDYSQYKKMKIKIKDYNFNGSAVLGFGMFDGNNNGYIKYDSLTGVNSSYALTKIQKGEFELDISDIDYSLYDEVYSFIRLYRENDTSLYLDIEAVWLEK